MPFGFNRKKTDTELRGTGESIAGADARSPRTVRLHGFTEDWRLEADVAITGRLLDMLNQREALSVESAIWAPIDGSAPMAAAPGITTLDPYDLIVVIATAETAAAISDEERAARRIHKVTYDVGIEIPPFRVVGTIQLHPGSEPDSLLERSNQMFTAVTDPWVTMNGIDLDLGPGVDAVLVNRFYMRGVEQVDRALGLPHPRLPGQGLGGTNWRDRT